MIMPPDRAINSEFLRKLFLTPEALELVKMFLLSCYGGIFSPGVFKVNGRINIADLGRLAPGGIAGTIIFYAHSRGKTDSLAEADIIEAFAINHATDAMDFIERFTAENTLTPAISYYKKRGLTLETERAKARFLFLDLAHSVVLTTYEDDGLFAAVYGYAGIKIKISGLCSPPILTASIGEKVVTHMGCIVATPANNPILTPSVLDSIAFKQMETFRRTGERTGRLPADLYRILNGERLDCRRDLGLNIPGLLKQQFSR